MHTGHIIMRLNIKLMLLLLIVASHADHQGQVVNPEPRVLAYCATGAGIMHRVQASCLAY